MKWTNVPEYNQINLTKPLYTIGDAMSYFILSRKIKLLSIL